VERDFERAPARGRERGQRLLEDVDEQSRESCKRESGLGLTGAVGKHAVGPHGLLDPGLPEDRLADTRFAGEHEYGGAAPDLFQKRLDGSELVFAPDECRRHRPLPILTGGGPDFER
jgi:hypothetical protein